MTSNGMYTAHHVKQSTVSLPSVTALWQRSRGASRPSLPTDSRASGCFFLTTASLGEAYLFCLAKPSMIH